MIFITIMFVMVSMTSMIVTMIFMVIMNMNLAIKMFSFAPDKGRTDSGFNGERPAIA